MSFWSKGKSEDKVQKEAQSFLADLRQELQDMDIQIINATHNRNAIIEKIEYFESKLPSPSDDEIKVEVSQPTIDVLKTA